MTTTLKLPFPILLVLSIFFSSCQGQSKGNPKELVINVVPAIGKTKMVKTQGSDAYQGVNCGIEDHQGNLWFGTSGEGVYRYDGKLFTQFTIQNGLSSNVVGALLEDRSKNIWIGTKNGLCCYDGKTMKQILLNADTASPSPNSAPPSYQVFSILQDKNGILWFGTASGVFCYDGNNFYPFLDHNLVINNDDLTLKNVCCMFEDKKGNLWFGSSPLTFEGLLVYDGKTLSKVNLKNENWIRNIREGLDGKLLITTRHEGTYTFNGKYFSALPQPAEMSNDLLTYALEDSKGNRWFASDYVSDDDITTGGLWRWDHKSFTAFTKKDGLSNSAASFIFEDSHKNLWIGTRDNGLSLFDGKTFSSYSE